MSFISALRRPERFHDGALVGLVDIDGERFERLVHHAVDGLGEHARLADGEFVALAAHVLDEDGEVQLAATRDAETRRRFGFFDAAARRCLRARASGARESGGW
jgi:hypothetical protein